MSSKKNKKPGYPSVNPQQDHLKSRNKTLKENTNVAVTATSATFSGPIPPPELLAKYDDIIPDGAHRILKMAESQSAHRQRIEKWAVIGGTILSYFGVACALIIALLTLYFGSQLIRDGHAVPGSLFAGVGLSGLVASFIYGTRSRREERLRRDQQNKELTKRK